MKLNKKQEAEIVQAYEAYFDNYVKGNVEAIASMLDDDYNQIGSAESEVFFNKKDALKFIYDTIDQVAGKTEIRNRILKVEPLEEFILVTDLFDIYALIEANWTFYSKFRASTLMRKKEGDWKFIHQHSSIPDAMAQEGDNIAIQKISEENQQLREAVKRRTIELVQKNRELEIEAALERVRARSMAMQKSEELAQVANLLYQQMQSLEIPAYSTGYCIWDDDDKQSATFWMSSEGILQPPFQAPLTEDPVFSLYREADQRGETFYAEEYSGEELVKHYECIMALPDVKELINELIGSGLQIPESQINHVVYFAQGFLLFVTHKRVPEAHEIFKRFGKVFEQTYTRFLDLQKVEAQTREAQIEAAMERVRARAMAMRMSDELGDAAVLLYKELQVLGLTKFINCGYVVVDEKNKIQQAWMTFHDGSFIKPITLPLKGDPILQERYKSWKQKDPVFHQTVGGDKLKKHVEFVAPDFGSEKMEGLTRTMFPDPTIFYCGNFSYGYLHLITGTPLSEEEESVLARFTRVFEMTYTRFLDLKQAEDQAREAQIEAALERIRSKALAMQNSGDLLDVSNVLREQMGKLGQQDLESSIVHIYNSSEVIEAWYTFRSTKTNSTKLVTDKAVIPIDSCEYIKETYKKYKSKETEYTIVSKGKKLVDWYNVMVKVAPDTIEYNLSGKMLVPEILYYHYSKFSGGSLLMISNEKPSEEAKELQRRAAKVFNLAYQRFLDLRQAEAQAKEAVKRASLDRVRGEIASMRSKEDLNRITPLVWQELTTLGIPFIRCGVFIIEETLKQVQVYLSTPSSTSLAAMQVKFNETDLIEAVVTHWEKKKVYREEWNQQQFIAWTKSLIDKGLIDSSEKYQVSEQAPERLVLQFIPFSQGILYVGSGELLEEDQILLVQSLADTFAVAYSRYEDYKHLEEAKNQMEVTLGDLKSTQTQLIHAEKMASLGELTAGIAHEIQNPLNFVNNFSELSIDLVEEMDEEMANGNMNEVKGIKEDIKQNLDKINHHGKRASSIVKGMLDHSRIGSRKKELTDINTLADEYLRLAYHGLRAKDKSFNADFKVDLDEKLPKINVIPQDFGRVMLNLINNAFYAVSSKALVTENGDYSPQVTVSTRRVDSPSGVGGSAGQIIEIRVKDNGSGIPADIKEKIFQPFFTTKPTGQGTGLGLSLSYDIITKGHNGKLEVDTREGIGSEFIIVLQA